MHPGRKRAARPAARRLLAPLLLAWLPGCSSGGDIPSSPTPEAAASRPTGVPVLLIGLDGADWDVARPLAEAGDLPTLGRLQAGGAWGTLQSEEPMLSPILWTTLATGRGPLEHGVLDFVETDPVTGRPMPVTVGQRRVPALWDVFTAAGLDSAVVAWWASWPAYPLRGRVVSDRVAYSTYRIDGGDLGGAGLFYPAELSARLGALAVEAADVGPDRMADLADIPGDRFEAADRALAAGASPFDDPVNHLRHVVASALTYHGMARALLDEGQPALFAVYYQGIDEVKHLFAHCRAPALPLCPPEDAAAFGGSIEGYYRFQDRLLGEILERASPETVVVVASDHGFRTGADRPRDVAPTLGRGRALGWHRAAGILLLSGPPIEPGRLRPHRLRDVAPTVLYLAGLPLADELSGRPALDAIREGFRAAHPAVRLASYSPWEPPREVTGPDALSDADQEALERLTALGYLAAGADGAPAAGDAAATLATVRRLTTEAFLWAKEGDLPEARRRLRRALDVDPGYLPAQAALADVYQREGRLAEALALYREVLPELAFTEPRLLALAADAFLAAGRGEEGIAILRPLAARGAGAIALQVAVARLLGGTARPDEAERMLREILERQPDSVMAMAALLRLLVAGGRMDEAAPLLERALQANPSSAPHLQWLGRMAEASGRLNEAAVRYMHASHAAPDRVEMLLDLGRVTARAGRLRDAEGIFRSATRAFPEEPRARFGLALVLEANGDPVGAREAFLLAEEGGLRTAELYRRLGRLEAATGNARAARGHLARSLEIDPAQPDVTGELEALGRR